MPRRIPATAPSLAFDVVAPRHFIEGWGKPLRFGDQVVLAAGGQDADSVLVAFDAADGQLRWTHAEPERGGWLTPPCRLGDEIVTLLRTGTTVTEIHLSPQGAVTARHEFDASDVHPPRPVSDTDYVLLERTRIETPFSTSLRRRGRAIWRVDESLELATNEWCVTRRDDGYAVRRLPSPKPVFLQETGVGRGFVSGIACTPETIVAIEHKALVARDLATGAHLWSFSRPNEAIYDVEADSAVVMQTLRSGENDDEVICLYVLSLLDGTLIASAPIPGRGYLLALDATHILTNESGTLLCRVLAEPTATAWRLVLPPHRSLAVFEDAIYLSSNGRLRAYRP